MYPFLKYILAGATLMSAASTSVQAVNSAPKMQVMSFKVSIDGREVMAPLLGMPAAGRAEVSISDSESDGYTLGVNRMKPDHSEGNVPDRLRLMLWRGSSHSGQPLLDQAMDVTTNGPSNKPRSVEVVNGQGGLREHVRIDLVSVLTVRADSWPPR